MRASLSDPDSPSTLNFRGVTVSSILAERATSANAATRKGAGWSSSPVGLRTARERSRALRTSSWRPSARSPRRPWCGDRSGTAQGPGLDHLGRRAWIDGARLLVKPERRGAPGMTFLIRGAGKYAELGRGVASRL